MIDLPPDWREAAAAIGGSGWRTVVVIGANGAGKSTFCRYLAESWNAALLDADIGQQTLAAPGTVALRRPASGIDSYFVGGTSPMGHLMGLLAGTARLARLAAGERLVCNTSGLVGGPGIALKTFKLDAVQADAVVAIAAADELAPILAAQRHRPLLRLRPSGLARRRSPAERKAARQESFARHLAGGRDLVLGPEIVLQRRPPPPERCDGVLCGLADATGACQGIGLLRSLQPLALFTAVGAEAIRLVQFGDLRLSPEGRELGAVHPHAAAPR